MANRRIKLTKLSHGELLNRIVNAAANAAFLENRHFDRSKFMLKLLGLEIKNGEAYIISTKDIFNLAKKLGLVTKFETYERV